MSNEETAVAETAVAATPAAEANATVTSVQQAADKAYARKMKALAIAGYTVSAIAVIGVAGSLLLSSHGPQPVMATASHAPRPAADGHPAPAAVTMHEPALTQAQAATAAHALVAPPLPLETLPAQPRTIGAPMHEQWRADAEGRLEQLERLAEQQLAAVESYVENLERLHAPPFWPASEWHHAAMKHSKAQREQARQRRAEILKSLREARAAAHARDAQFQERRQAVHGGHTS